VSKADHQLTSAQIDDLCDRFESACKAGQAPRVEDFVADFGETDRQVVVRELLFIEHAYRCRNGHPPTDTEFHRRFPDLKDLVDEVLYHGAGHGMETEYHAGHTRDFHSQPEAVGGGHPALAGDSLLEALPVDEIEATTLRPTLGDYELLEEIGRGGMGIVFRARQKSADRIVAVKILRRDKLSELSPDARETMIERFRTESQSTAQLEHDNIVPVYEVGNANGLHYYSMKFIEGESLADLIKDRPLDNRTAAELIEPIARALAAAHAHGVLHRDIKPRNIMRDRKTGRPLLADFGLAKLVEAQREVTHTGDVMGSPPYMSPEQANDAARVTEAADVYSLGATLYHLLTGRPPFQAANVAETMRQVWYDDPIPPRQLNPDIDRDLETICLKCLEKEPSRRFASATEMADELRRMLRGEPINSRPIGLAGRFRRWCRRSPVVASLVGTVALLAMLLIGGLVIGNLQISQSLEKERASLIKAQKSLNLATGAVDKMTDIATKDDGLKAHGLDRLRKEILAASKSYYDYFVQEQSGDPKLEAERGRAYGRLADIEADLGNPKDAVALYKQADDVFVGLRRRYPTNPEYVWLRASYMTNLAALHRDLGDRIAALESLAEAFALANTLVSQQPEVAENPALLAHIHNERAVLFNDEGQPQKAEQAWLAAIGLWQKLGTAKREAEHEHQFAQCHNNLAVLYRSLNRDADAEKHFAAAMKIWEQLNGRQPEVSAYMGGLATCLYNLGMLHLDRGQHEQAEEMLGGSLRLRNLLADKHRHVPQYRDEQALSQDGIGLLHQARGEFDEAASAFRDALLIREALRNQFADIPQYDIKFAASQNNLGDLYRSHGRHAEAGEYFLTALDILTGVIRRHGDEPVFRAHLAGVHDNLALVLAASEIAGAEKHAKSAVDIRELLAKEHRTNTAYQTAWAASLAQLASIKSQRGEHDEALRQQQAAVDVVEKLVAAHPRAAQFKLALGENQRQLGVLLADAQKLREADEALEAAVKTLRGLTAEPEKTEAAPILQSTLIARCQVADAMGEHERALARWDEVLALVSAEDKPLYTLRRAVSQARSGDHAGAAMAAGQLMLRDERAKSDPWLQYQFACVASRCAEAAEADQRIADPADRARIAAQYLDPCVLVVTQLIAQNPDFFTDNALEDDPDFARLREHPAIRELLDEQQEQPE
jgi:serine/threonine protein kinase